MKIKNIKEKVTNNIENLRKKYETETQNTVECHSNRLEQVEDRISKHKDKIEIKENNDDLLVKQPNTCERNNQELTDSIKRPNLRIMALKKEKRSKQKGFIIYSIKKKKKQKISQVLKKFCSFRYKKPPGHQIDLTKIKPLTTYYH
jgi:chromosome segregation ATPase